MDAQVRDYLRKYRAAKAASTKARVAGEAMLALPTRAQVDEFATRIRQLAGVNDVTLIDDELFEFFSLVNGQYVTDGTRFGRDTVIEVANKTVENGGRYSVDFPGLFNYGTKVVFEGDGCPMAYAKSLSYGPTETYLSM